MKTMRRVFLAGLVLLFLTGCSGVSSESSNIKTAGTTKAADDTASLITDRDSQEVSDLRMSVERIKFNDFVQEGAIYFDNIPRFGIVDRDSVSVEISSSDGSVFVKSITNNTGLKPGINKVKVTIANKVAQADVVCLVYRHDNMDDKYMLAFDRYKRATDFYWSEGDLEFDKVEAYDGMPLCTNFTEVANKLFTSNGLRQFTETYPPFVYYEKDNKHYFDRPSRGMDGTYIGTVLIPKSSAENKLVYTARSYYDDWETSIGYTVEDRDFILNNRQGQWLIDSFVLPN